MTQILCARCYQQKPMMASKPPGKFGPTIQAQVCDDCWAEWRMTAPKVINHYGLNLGLPEDRAQLQSAMVEFLNLPG